LNCPDHGNFAGFDHLKKVKASEVIYLWAGYLPNQSFGIVEKSVADGAFYFDE
jgi:hypothetical protein